MMKVTSSPHLSSPGRCEAAEKGAQRGYIGRAIWLPAGVILKAEPGVGQCGFWEVCRELSDPVAWRRVLRSCNRGLPYSDQNGALHLRARKTVVIRSPPPQTITVGTGTYSLRDYGRIVAP